jgi:hypothetical protein
VVQCFAAMPMPHPLYLAFASSTSADPHGLASEAALQEGRQDFFVARCQIHSSLPAFPIANGQDLHQNLRMPDE